MILIPSIYHIIAAIFIFHGFLEIGSVKLCKQEDALNGFMRCVLYIPQFLPENKTFDFVVVVSIRECLYYIFFLNYVAG